MSCEAGRAADDPLNLSGSGDDIATVGEAGDTNVSSPPNLSVDRSSVICKGIWPGSHNVSLLSYFVSLYFVGDWSAYLQFCAVGRCPTLLYPNVLVHLDSWLSLKSDLAKGDGGLGGLPEKSHGGSGSNMCNETCNDSVVVPHHSTPSRILSPKGDLRSIFPVVQARTAQGSNSQAFEEAIALQAVEEAAQVARLDALRVKFAAAAQLKFATPDATAKPEPPVSAIPQHKSVPPTKEAS